VKDRKIYCNRLGCNEPRVEGSRLCSAHTAKTAEINARMHEAWTPKPKPPAPIATYTPKPPAPVATYTPPPAPLPEARPEGRTGIECPYCHTVGEVKVSKDRSKAGVSGAKLTGAVLTAGLSILGTGLSRKEKVNHFECKACGVTWTDRR